MELEGIGGVVATSSAGLSDEVSAELNPTGPGPDYGPQADSIPARPTDGASKEKWVDYAVALGADRTFLTEDTTHAADTGPVTKPALTRAELIKLADRLGG